MSSTTTAAPRRVLLAAPRGYCAGVDRAVETVERALELHGAPVYVRKEIVHNKHVVEELSSARRDLRRAGDRGAGGRDGRLLRPRRRPGGARERRGAAPADDRRHLPAGHQGPRRGAALRRRRIHDRDDRPRRPRGGRRDDRRGAESIVLVQTADEVERLEVPDPERLAFITQTTLSVDETAEIIAALRARFPAIASPKSDDICYATTNRQIAVKQLARECDLVLVIGSTQLLELQPPGRGRPRARRRLAPDRQPQPGTRGVAGGRRDGRHHLRRQRPRGAGRAAGRPSSASGGRRRSPSCARSTRRAVHAPPT